MGGSLWSALPGGLSKTIPGFRPSGALRATKFVPDKFVEPALRVAIHANYSVAERLWS